ncbi:MAG TPA: hypothetical protein VF310_07540 [Vicinamibacteria bacterium]
MTQVEEFAMACCGGNRARLAAAYAAPGAVKRGEAPVDGPRFTLAYEYLGHMPLTLVGAASGQRYRFTPGSILVVDPRDRPALATMPLLRRR